MCVVHLVQDLIINDVDFTAKFDEFQLELRWKWKDGIEPILQSGVKNFPVPERLEKAFSDEIED